MSHAEGTLLKIEDHGAVLIIALDRPLKKNALNSQMYQELTAALKSAEERKDIRVVLFRGRHGTFCAGNDLSDFLIAGDESILQSILDFLHTLTSFTKPLLAAVEGAAVGVGTTLLFHCDMVLASETARFLTPFTDLGLVPEAASSLLGPRLLGHQRAFELLVLGEPFDAKRALDAGLINRIVPSENLKHEALRAAQALAMKNPEAIRLSRRLLRGDPAEILKRIDEEGKLFAERLRAPDTREAIERFLTRRTGGLRNV